MEKLVLEAEPREITGKKVKALRRQGKLPAVMYGKGLKPIALQLDAREASKILSRSGAASLLDLKIGKEVHKVLLRDVQRDIIRRHPIHVDFLEVAMDVAIRTEVPVELIGEAPAVSDYGGVLVTGVSEIEVEALPGDLVDRVTVDLSTLTDVGDSITVADLDLGGRVKILTDPSELIARIIFKAEEVEEEVVEELVPLEAEPEVIERGKKEEEAGEKGEAEAQPD